MILLISFFKNLRIWTRGGNYYGLQLISGKSYETITSPKIQVDNKADQWYGFGWQIEFNNGGKVLSHGGGMPGYKSFITIDAKNHIGIIILTNKITYFPEELTGIIYEYLQSNKVDWQETDKSLLSKNFNFPWDDNSDTSYRPDSFIPNISAYEGRYEDKQYGTVVIQSKEGQSRLVLLPSKDQFFGNLYYINRNTFKIVFTDKFIPAGKIIFEWGKNKKVTGFRMEIPGNELSFKYLNFRKNN